MNNSNFGSNAYAPKTLRVYFHVIRRTDGSGGYLPYDVAQSFNILQGDYTTHGISFAWDGCIDYIDNSAYYTSGSGINNIYTVNTHTDGIDIYLFPASHPSAGGRANGVGSNAQFWVAGSWDGVPVALTHIISHEMGHVIFLWHTHHGTVNEGGSDTGQCKEFVDGTNASFCGDYVVDTPADPHLQFNVNASCQWNGSGQDAHGDPYNPDEHNIMAYTRPACMQYVSSGQAQRMHQAILSLPYLTACQVTGTVTLNHCNCPASDLVISQNTTIDQDLYVTGDIRIINGAALTVTATIYFKTGKGIDQFQNCKLIVDGGTLTSCDPTWRGIRVTGGNTDFDVKFTNNAVGENTASALVSMFAPFPWPQIQQFGNGILHAENSTFNNTRRIVEMMAWSPSFNKSYITDCVQNGGKWSITNWNCIGVLVKNNVFNNISENCIVTETGQFLIEGNQFNSVTNDILFANVSPGFGTTIARNVFQGASTGVRALGTTLAQNKIEENQFQTGEFDIFMDGVNSYLIRDNDITSDFGAVSIDNGIHSNDVFDNRLSGNFIGLAPLGSNTDYTFYQNCFTTSFSDAYIEGQIAGNVSAGTNAASNCFTHLGNVNSPVFDITGNPSPFNYIEPNNTVPNCLNAVKAHPNVTRQLIGPATMTTPCGTSGTGNPIPPQYNPCNPIKTIEGTTQAINWLNAKILEIQNNPNLSAWQKQWLIAIYRRCLKRVTMIKFELQLSAGLYTDARSLLASDNSDEAKTAIYTSYIYENNLQGAAAFLNNLSQTSEALGDFKTIQSINLNRLPFGPLYVPSNSELSTVLSIANKTHPYAGYAKALYFHLTGVVLQSDLPAIFEKHTTPRSMNKKEIKASIYPNPFTNQFNVKYIGDKDGIITVIDLFGKPVFTSIINTDMIVSADGWNAGMYIVRVQTDNETIAQEKIILIH
ncbi:MAG TPA: T9SS type A sorting domain-containing protein [Saprospiraceae bacterium]|nr:T9SS type A sorting domain-containing protein [Saprospiraceae bacterium]HMT71680.1 T9SS type A sorting domain-containing protein [Saprospiraceae bacterium]